MTNGIIPLDQFSSGGNLPSVFGPVTDADFDALTNGVSLGYGVLSFRGKVWRVRHGGEEKVLRDAEGQPLRKLRCVIVASNAALSKTFYEGAYEPGSTSPPDCSSLDGVRPDQGVSNPQSISCATCHNNQFGSKVSDAGKKMKACTDSRRLALVPFPDVANEMYGGPMLLRVPPASLDSLAKATGVLKQNMVPPHAAVIDVAFDLEAEYPMLTFTPRAGISDAAVAEVIMAHRAGDVVRQILHGANTALPMLTAVGLPSQTALAAPAKPAAKPAAAKPAKVAKPAPAPAPVTVAANDDDILFDDPKPKPTGRRVESAPAPTPAAAADDDGAADLNDDDDALLGDILSGLDD